MRLRVCYLNCHEAGLCCYVVIHIEHLLRPLQLLYFHMTYFLIPLRLYSCSYTGTDYLVIEVSLSSAPRLRTETSSLRDGVFSSFLEYRTMDTSQDQKPSKSDDFNKILY
jgi:hypothetical protein